MGRPPKISKVENGKRIVEARIPYVPREWAKPFHASYRRFLSLILHRRAGKTTAVLNHHVRASVDDRWEANRLKYLSPGLTDAQLRELLHPPGGRHYGHVMPTRVQAKMVAWDKLKYYALAVPEAKANEAELLVRMPNGNKVQLFGADDPDAMRGIAPSGLSFDEFSQQPSNIFSEVLSKALGDHLGYAIFAGTIKGKDHLYKTYAAGKSDPLWFALWQDVGQSLKQETGITIQVLAQAMADDQKLVAQGLMTQEEFDQEWFLSLEAAIKGAYYAKQLAEVRKSGRITTVPYDPEYPVCTAWDLGYTDDSAIIFYQNIGDDIRVIDFFCESGGTIEIAVGDQLVPGTLTREVLSKPYRYDTHWLPHDAKAKSLGADGKSVIEKLGKYFTLGKLAIVPSLSVQDGIQAVRGVLGRCWFDESRCDGLINALLHYKRKHDSRLDVLSIKPVHDWSSHPADAMRMLAIAERREIREVEAPKKTALELIPGLAGMTLDDLWARRDEQLAEAVRI